MVKFKKSHKSYPQAFKDEAVLMVLEQGPSSPSIRIKHCHSSDSQQAHPCVLDRDIHVTDGHFHDSA
ncbi:hypothetical protein G3488_07375 [Shewanella baltica]|uniref:hypothetical protein n=1 Tax=Shewanella baltica TaxID=62322 RepID=UPI00217CF6CE|nr:hypothetical protein [Shewanella baltica]MCS6230669.1 hypothetical protein [Shewanella baltica]